MIDLERELAMVAAAGVSTLAAATTREEAARKAYLQGRPMPSDYSVIETNDGQFHHTTRPNEPPAIGGPTTETP